jgi:CHAD domain-containing protein
VEPGTIAMAFRMREGEGIREGVRRIAWEQLDAALAETCDPALPRAEKVRQVRKRCKKLRALLRLYRPLLGDHYPLENAHYRDAARLLSPVRDAQSLLDVYDALMARFEDEVARRTYAPVRRRLARRRRWAAEHGGELGTRLEEVRGLLEAGRERVPSWPIDATDADAWRGGFEHTYGKARRAMAAAYDATTAEHFHEWRKGAKYHWYHTRLLRPIWSRALGAREREADVLGEILGAHHDLTVLRAALLEDDVHGRGGRDLVEQLVELICRRRAELEAAARPLGARLFAERPRQIGGRHGRYWDAWQAAQRCGRVTAQEPVAASA